MIFSKNISLVTLILLWGGFIIFSGCTSTVQPQENADWKPVALLNAEKDLVRGYVRKDDKIYYKFTEDLMEVKNADLSSFMVSKVDPEYAKDKNRAYVWQKWPEPIHNANPETFTVLGNDYSKDATTLYGWGGVPLPSRGADLPSIQSLNAFYLKDKDNVFCRETYYKISKIENADVGSFNVIIAGYEKNYAKDKNNLFYGCKIIEGAHLESFTIDDNEQTYARDQFHVFYRGKIIEGADPASFRLYQASDNNDISQEVYARDNKHAYEYGKPIEKADVETFQGLDFPYSKDQHHVFWHGQIIEGADPASFHVFILQSDGERKYAKDNRAVYWESEKIVEADPLTFTITTDNGGTPFDKNYYYKDGIPIPKTS